MSDKDIIKDSKLKVLQEQAKSSSCSLMSNGESTLTTEEGEVLAQENFSGNVLLVTLGCAKNQVDSEVMLGALKTRGFRPISTPENADLIVINTCGFLQSAVEEGIDSILSYSSYKKKGRCKKLVVAGCMVERYREQLLSEFPEVDMFLSTDEITTIGEISSTTEQCLNQSRRPYFIYDETMPRVISSGEKSAFVKISEGCDRPCSFCIIPKLRGGFRSRPIDSIVKEVLSLRSQGVSEVSFVAQDLTAYGSDFPGNRGVKSELTNLLESLDKNLKDSNFDELFWLRLHYAYPIGVTDKLLEQITSYRWLCNYLDLPLQHISANVLKAMRRPLGEKGTRSLIENMSKNYPQIALRTTFIIGFPGETEEDVNALENFVREGHFSHIGVFSYSQEEEADSFSYENQIDEEIKEQRKERILLAQQEVLENSLTKHIGQKYQVLLEGHHSDTDLLRVGRTEFQGKEVDGQVIINDLNDIAPESLVAGNFVEVEITEIAGYDLVGRVV